MTKIVSFTEFSDYEKVRKLWNDEVGFIYPITERLFAQNVSNSRYLAQNASFVAFVDEKLIGVVIVKSYSGEEIPAYKTRAWISLFYVSKYFRNQGIGSSLLEKAHEEVKKMGKTDIQIGQDLNNFFPGIPCDFDNITDNFLKKRGYTMIGYTHDLMLKEYKGLDIIYKNDVTYRFLEEDDKEKLYAFMEKNFPGRWVYEMYECINNEPKLDNYYVAIKDDKVIGFIRTNNSSNKNISYNINWYSRFSDLVGIGPLGIDRDYRKRGISKEMIASLLKRYKEQGKKEILIDWTGLMLYYQQFGFEVWKCYMKARKEL